MGRRAPAPIRAANVPCRHDGLEEMTQAERMWERLWVLLYTAAGHNQVYVYRLDPDDQSIGGYIWKGPAWPELPEILRDAYGGGEFRILIRKKRQMVFAGNFSVERPRDGLTT